MDGKEEVKASSNVVQVESKQIISQAEEKVKASSAVVQVDPQTIISDAKGANQTVIHFDSTVFSTEAWLDYYNLYKDSADQLVSETASARHSILLTNRHNQSKHSQEESEALYGENSPFPWSVPGEELPSKVVEEFKRGYCLNNTTPNAICNIDELRQQLKNAGIGSIEDQNFVLLSMHQGYVSIFFTPAGRFTRFFGLLLPFDINSGARNQTYIQDQLTYLVKPFDEKTRIVRLRQQYVHGGKVVANADVVLNLDTKSIRYENVFMVVDKSYAEVAQAFANVPESLLHLDQTNSAITFVTPEVRAARAWIAEQEQRSEKEYKELAQAAKDVLEEIPTWFTDETFNQNRRERFEQALEQVRLRHYMDIKVPIIFSQILNAPDPYAPKSSTSFPWKRLFKWLLWSLIILFSMMMVFGSIAGVLLGKDLGFIDILTLGTNANIIIFGAVGVGFLLLAQIYGSATWQDFCKSNWSIALPIIGLVVGALLIIAVPVIPAANLASLSDPAIFSFLGVGIALFAFSLLFGLKRFITPVATSTTPTPTSNPQSSLLTPSLRSFSSSVSLNRFVASFDVLVGRCGLRELNGLEKTKDFLLKLKNEDTSATPISSGGFRGQELYGKDNNYANVADALQIYCDQGPNNIDPAVNGCLQTVLGKYKESQAQQLEPSRSVTSLSSSGPQ